MEKPIKPIKPFIISNLESVLSKYALDFDLIPKKENNWKLPDNYPEVPKESKKKSTKRKKLPSREEILKPLDSVFIDDMLKDEIVIRTAIPDLLEGNEPAYNGIILFGPPGTGKTVLLRAIGEVYQTIGAYSREVSVSSVNSAFVGQFAKNLEEQIQLALTEAESRKKPSFLFFDEGSILAQSAAEGADSVSKHYQEAIDVLKRYIGNERNLVTAISTNLLSESFEDALTREGRLSTFFIGYPDVEQRKRMWLHFADKSKVMVLSNEQAYKLAEETPVEQGAFIEEFCRNYRRARRTAILGERGYRTLVDALKKNVSIAESEITASISFDNLYNDLRKTLEVKYNRLQADKKENESKSIGFRR